MRRAGGLAARGAFVALALLICTGASVAQAPSRPNLLVILADDLGVEGLSCYGGRDYRTPNLDALAARGVRFTNCSTSPLCTPSRVQLLTGQYPFRTGWTDLISARPPARQVVDPRLPTFASVLRARGYETGVFGKWQLAQLDRHPEHPRALGFDVATLWAWLVDGVRTPRYWFPAMWRDGQLLETSIGDYGPDLVRDALIEFVTRPREAPFLAFYPMLLPHEPFLATPDSWDGTSPRRSPTPAKKRGFRDMVEYLDRQVGRVLAALEEAGLSDSTLVVFSSDNGSPANITSRRGPGSIDGGKFSLTAAGTHVPLIVAGPGVVGGRTCLELTDFSDLFPTLLELGSAGAPAGHVLDGRSLVPWLRGEQGETRSWVFVQSGEQRFVSDGRFKLYGDGRFFDLSMDRGETAPLMISGLGVRDVHVEVVAHRDLRRVLDELR